MKINNTVEDQGQSKEEAVVNILVTDGGKVQDELATKEEQESTKETK